MNQRESFIVIFLGVILFSTIGYRLVMIKILNRFQEKYEKHHSPSSSSLSSISSNNYYSSSKYPNLDNMSNEMKEVMVKSRQPIPSSYEINFIDVHDVYDGTTRTTVPKAKQPQTNNNNNNNGVDDNSIEQGNIIQEETIIIPFYWHVPRSGGSTISNLLGQCLELTLASASSLYDTSPKDTFYQHIFNNDESDILRIQWYEHIVHVNVNLDTKEGIERASRLGVLQNEISSPNGGVYTDVVVSPLVYDISNILFDSDSNIIEQSASTNATYTNTNIKASLFTMFRHPIEREISYFYHLKKLKTVEMIDKFEFIDWLQSDYFVDNVMIRSLVNRMDKSYQVTLDDLLVAKEILRRKCIIGLLEKKAESWERFQRSFEKYWHNRHTSDEEDDDVANPKYNVHDHHCQSKLLGYDWPNKNKNRPMVDISEDSLNEWDIVEVEAFNQLKDVNGFDLMLYEYAKYLFQEQGSYFK